MNSVRGREVDDRGSNLWKGQHQNGNVPTLLRDVASVRIDETYGEYHRRNMQRMVTVTANVHQTDLGAAAAVVAVAEKLGELPDPPRGVTVSVRGQLAPLSQIFENFRLGVVLSMIAVFLLLVWPTSSRYASPLPSSLRFPECSRGFLPHFGLPARP